ncbi:hypothetical protein B0T20DRAFT_511635 [Sordaria brevicollis]|uniref:Uncharacterized protein n=1 Tax=Sordaria brevicollis TaxID=83679 RepID=A0AAE0U235_SORBR|nr:hypothetical protein B0T20DRAFT_511635 [Sordaria brevicollis]
MSSSSRTLSEGEEIKPAYYSIHSFLFLEITKRHPNLTNEELEQEFETILEGEYIAKLLDPEGTFYHISPSQVDAFKKFVADVELWRRYLSDDFEGDLNNDNLNPKQHRSLVAKFQAHIAGLKAENAELKENHAAEKEKGTSALQAQIIALQAQCSELILKHAAEKEKWQGVALHNEMSDWYNAREIQDKQEHAEEIKKLESEHATQKKNLKKKHATEKSELRKKLEEEQKKHAEEINKLKDEHEKTCQYHRNQIVKLAEANEKLHVAKAADSSAFDRYFHKSYETEIDNLQTQNRLLKLEIEGLKRQKKNLEKYDGVPYAKFQELVAENAALKADNEQKDNLIDLTKREVATWKHQCKELQMNSGPDEWLMKMRQNMAPSDLKEENKVLRDRLAVMKSQYTKAVNRIAELNLALTNKK